MAPQLAQPKANHVYHGFELNGPKLESPHELVRFGMAERGLARSGTGSGPRQASRLSLVILAMKPINFAFLFCFLQLLLPPPALLAIVCLLGSRVRRRKCKCLLSDRAIVMIAIIINVLYVFLFLSELSKLPRRFSQLPSSSLSFCVCVSCVSRKHRAATHASNCCRRAA